MKNSRYHRTLLFSYIESTKSRFDRRVFFPIYKPAILSISETKLFIVYRITTLVRREITVLFVERKAPELKHVDQTAGNDSGAFKQRFDFTRKRSTTLNYTMYQFVLNQRDRRI